jgi:tetraacyldisaccharide 4'-kinase
MTEWLGSLYGAAATWRRRWYLHDPSRRRQLRQPVISIGNLSVGGSGKTPITAAVARLLIQRGERPSILSQGYRRPRPQDGVTIVSDGVGVRADFDTAGDEPLMLARMLPGASVLVGSSRYLSGRLAEEKLGATVHLLDDGFQHVELARDVDLLVASEVDLHDRPLPTGRLREPLLAAALADAALVEAGYEAEAERIGRALGVASVFRVERTLGPPRHTATGDTIVVPTDEPVFGLAGIARPERFFTGLASAGWRVVGTMTFRDHHAFTDRDIARVSAAARAAGAAIIMTTEKDAVRLSRRHVGRPPIAAVPLTASILPAARFAEWLSGRLAAARTDHRSPGRLQAALTPRGASRSLEPQY